MPLEAEHQLSLACQHLYFAAQLLNADGASPSQHRDTLAKIWAQADQLYRAAMTED